MSGDAPLVTPDGRYLVVRGRLWRRTDPTLPEERRAELVHELMDARRAKKAALADDDHAAVATARSRVEAAKTALGERGPVWWSDDAPDETRRMARTTRYADWFAAAEAEAQAEATGEAERSAEAEATGEAERSATSEAERSAGAEAERSAEDGAGAQARAERTVESAGGDGVPRDS